MRKGSKGKHGKGRPYDAPTMTEVVLPECDCLYAAVADAHHSPECAYWRAFLQQEVTQAPRLPTQRVPTHPGVILWEEFLLPAHDGSFCELAKTLAKKYGTTEMFWVNLHRQHTEGEKNDATDQG